MLSPHGPSGTPCRPATWHRLLRLALEEPMAGWSTPVVVTHLGAVSFKGCGLAHDRCGQAGRARGSGPPRRASRTLE